MASYLIDLFVPRIRKSAITTMMKAYVYHRVYFRRLILFFPKLNIPVASIFYWYYDG